VHSAKELSGGVHGLLMIGASATRQNENDAPASVPETESQPRKPAGEELALRVRRGQPQGVLERRPRLFLAAQGAQRIR